MLFGKFIAYLRGRRAAKLAPKERADWIELLRVFACGWSVGFMETERVVDEFQAYNPNCPLTHAECVLILRGKVKN